MTFRSSLPFLLYCLVWTLLLVLKFHLKRYHNSSHFFLYWEAITICSCASDCEYMVEISRCGRPKGKTVTAHPSYNIIVPSEKEVVFLRCNTCLTYIDANTLTYKNIVSVKYNFLHLHVFNYERIVTNSTFN